LSQPIQRDGVWWHQKADGTWLRWNAPKGEWDTAPAPPPPPAPPGETSGATPVLPQSTQARGEEPAFGFSTAAASETSIQSDLDESSESSNWELSDNAPEDDRALGPANADVLPPESESASASDWLNANRPVAALIALILLAAAVFAAFTFMGGDDETPPGGATPDAAIGTAAPTKALARKLDALCTTATRKMKDVGNPTSTAEFVDYLGKAKSTMKVFMRGLHDINPGQKSKATFAELVKDFEQSMVYIDDVLAAAQAGDGEALQQKLVEYDSFSKKMMGRARTFGALACAGA